MSVKKFKLNDHVIVTTGSDKGVEGPIMAISIEKGKIKIKGANIKKKYIKANPQENQPGEIRSIEGWIDISNVAHYDASTKKPFKVGFMIDENGKKVRINKLTKKEIN